MFKLRDKGKNKIYYLITAAIILIIILSIAFYSNDRDTYKEVREAPDFNTVDMDGQNISMSDHEGEVVVLHITNIEYPLCLECEEELKGQCRELNELREIREDLTILTVNMRKFSGSMDGRAIVEDDWEIDVTWHWIEDHEPYDIAGKYMDYWNLDGGVSNPTVIFVDEDQNIAAVYNVYQMGKGKVDGIQTAERLNEKVDLIESGEWESEELEVRDNRITFFGMFGLGIITSFSPCSIALLIAMLSYIMGSLDIGDEEERDHSKEGLLIGVFFTVGMAMVFFVLGVFLSYVSIFISASVYFYMGAGILLVMLGLNNIYPLSDLIRPLFEGVGKAEVGISYRDKINQGIVSLFKNSILLGSLTLGIFFALAWAPCAISLILPVFIWVLSENLSILVAGALLFVFGLGHGVPIIPLAVVSRRARASIGEKYISFGKYFTKIFGVVIIAIGVILMLRFFGFYLW